MGLGIALRRTRQAERWVVVGILVVFAMIPVRSGISAAERTHLFEYGLLALILHEAFLERRRAGGAVPSPGLLAVVLASLLGWPDEAVQALHPDRVYDVRDVGRNVLAAVMAVTAVAAVRWGRRRAAGARAGGASPGGGEFPGNES